MTSGPVFDGAQFEDGAARVAFDLFGSGLAASRGGEPLRGFELAGADGIFHPADAHIDAASIVVSSSTVPLPHAVRYAWKNNASEANLVNIEGWPASPFLAKKNGATQAAVPGTTLIAHLGRDEGDNAGLATLRSMFRQRNPGYDIEYMAGVSHIPSARTARIVFVQEETAGRSSYPAMVNERHSETGGGDIIVLRSGESLDTKHAMDFLMFTVPSDLPDELPTFIRPDWDERITDTPGGCATETGAYRRILLTWLEKNGPYILHGRSTPIACASPIPSRTITRSRAASTSSTSCRWCSRADDSSSAGTRVQNRSSLTGSLSIDGAKSRCSRTHALEVGDLVYIPRGIIHRGVGGVLAQVITDPRLPPRRRDRHRSSSANAINESPRA